MIFPYNSYLQNVIYGQSLMVASTVLRNVVDNFPKSIILVHKNMMDDVLLTLTNHFWYSILNFLGVLAKAPYQIYLIQKTFSKACAKSWFRYLQCFLNQKFNKFLRHTHTYLFLYSNLFFYLWKNLKNVKITLKIYLESKHQIKGNSSIRNLSINPIEERHL